MQLHLLKRVSLLWIGLMILFIVHVQLGSTKITRFLCYGYMLATSFALTKFLENRDITERFGLQRNNVIVLLIFTYSGLAIAYFFDISKVDLIFLAPLIEEIFFRGYLLGTLFESCHSKGKRISCELKCISVTSLFFSLTHIFGHDPTQLSTYIQLLMVFLGGFFLGSLYVRSGTITWIFAAHMLHNVSGPLGLGVLRSLFPVVSFVIVAAYYSVKLIKEKGNSNRRSLEVT